MSDRIFLRGMEFEGRHGVSDEERAMAQAIGVDVEVSLDLRAAGTSDDLADTVDYGDIFEICRAQVEQRSYHLLEAIGEAIAGDVLRMFGSVDTVAVTVTKPGVPIDGIIEGTAIRIERSRPG